ncbi:MAG TPA: hypothetical protein PKC28_12400 [Bdellovibrionales bacterium]|nr:hypothetical protein [Bdellovibrionales bacterium]
MSLLLVSPAWALDFDHEISRQSADSAQIVSTLGRGKSFSSAKSSSKVSVKLIQKKKLRKRL